MDIFKYLFLAISILLVVTYVLFVKFRWDGIYEHNQTSLSYINRQLSQNTQATLNSHELVLRVLAEELLFLGADDDPERARRAIDQIVKVDPGMAGFGLIRPDGQLLIVSGVPAGNKLPNLIQQPESRDSFIEVLKANRLQTGRAYFMPTLKQWVIPIRVPVRNATGKLVFVMAAGYKIDGGTTSWNKQALPKGISITLLRADGYPQYIYPTQTTDYQNLYGEPWPNEFIQSLKNHQTKGFIRTKNPLTGENVYLAYEWLNQENLLALTYIPVRTVFESWISSMTLPSVWLLVYILLSYFLIYFARHRLFTSQARLTKVSSFQAAILDGADYAIISTDINGIITSFNKGAEKMLGYRADEVINKTSPEIFHDKNEILKRALLLKDEYQVDIQPGFEVFIYDARFGLKDEHEWTYVRKDNSRLPVILSVTAIHDTETKEVSGFLGIAADITARKKAQQQLKHSQSELIRRNESLRINNEMSQRLHETDNINAIAKISLEILERDMGIKAMAFYLVDNNLHELNIVDAKGLDQQAINSLYTIPVENSLIGQSLKSREVIVVKDTVSDPRISPKIREVLQKAGVFSEIILPLAYGNTPLGSINLSYETDALIDNLLLETLVTLSNTISLAIINSMNMLELKDQATHDSLTGLANRSLLHNKFKDITKTQHKNIALALVDLDRFKDINDTLGHQIGDQLLKQIGQRLEQKFSDSSIVCRLGGDEFAILLTDIHKEGKEEAQQLLAAIREPFELDTMKLEIDASLGIANYPRDGESSHELLRSADVAMYMAKQFKSGFMLYDVNTDYNTPERLALISDLNGATTNEQFVLHFQPKLDINDQAIIGFEALVRWNHPERGLLYPDAFMQMAELSEVIHPMTLNIIDMACAQIKRWLDAGLNYKVAINLSSRNLIDDRCVNAIHAAIENYAIPAALIEIEITETMLMHDPERATMILHKISDLGVDISVDDYGTGYSSLAYLHQLPINTLKIDRTFVKDMISNKHDHMIVNSTIELAHNLDLAVVAEGVEDIDTLRALRALGCDLAQGYYISRPLAADSFTLEKIRAIESECQTSTH